MDVRQMNESEPCSSSIAGSVWMKDILTVGLVDG